MIDSTKHTAQKFGSVFLMFWKKVLKKLKLVDRKYSKNSKKLNTINI